MTVYDERPWLGLYGDQVAAIEPEHASALEMFRAGLYADPDGDAIRYFDGVISRRELDELSDACASGLLAEGFEPGDRLAAYLQNVPQFVIAMLAAWKAGGIFVSINPMSRERELRYLLEDSGATVLLAQEGLYDEIGQQVVPGSPVRLVLTTSELEFQTEHDERLFAGTTRSRHEGATDLVDLMTRHRGQTPPPVSPTARTTSPSSPTRRGPPGSRRGR